jgi:hypothetical protein
LKTAAIIAAIAALIAPQNGGSKAPLPRRQMASYSFRILVDDNQLSAADAADTAAFVADGVHDITGNPYPAGGAAVNWTAALANLDAASYCITEDLYSFNGVTAANPAANTQAYIGYTGRLPNAVMAYNEGTSATGTLLTPAQIAYYANLVGPHVVVLARSYGIVTPPTLAAIQAAVANPDVSGLMFEFNPIGGGCSTPTACAIAKGVQWTLSQGKACYLLMPSAHAPAPLSYLAAVQGVVAYLAAYSPTILENPNLYLTLAAYTRPGSGVYFVPQAAGDPQAIGTVVQWLKAYRAAGSGGGN